MSEKDRSGREPISVIEIEQDLCSRDFGVPPCQGGKTNYHPEAQVWGAGTNWLTPRYDVTVNQSGDPFGGNYAILFENNNAVGSNEIRFNDLSFDETRTLWATLYVKTLGDIDGFRLSLEVQTGSYIVYTIEVDLTDGSFTNGIYGGSAFSTAATSDEGSGWYKLEVSLIPSLLTDLVDINYVFQFTDGTFAPAVGQQALAYGFQLAIESGQDYLPTFGEAVTFEDLVPCFNTRGTCQDTANYDNSETLTLKFVNDRSPQLRDGYYLPSLTSASVSPAELNLGGSNRSQSALGKRAILSASFRDHPHNDRLVDPYLDQRTYDPLGRGTFWTKWRARNPYYLNRVINFKTGYLDGGSMVETINRGYVITGFTGPNSNGVVTIQAKDILTKAEDAKAQAPIASTGKLLAAIDDVVTSATLTPAGIGDIEYGLSGFVRFEKEVCSYTRTGGSDVLTLVRGVEGTEAAAHDINTVAQDCLDIDADKPQDILYLLLNTYAGIDAAYLDKTQWDAEQLAHLPQLYSTLISEPTSVAKLVGEMCEQMFFSVWWDERESLVKIRAVRNAQEEEITDLNDDANLLADSISWKDLPDELISQVWIFYGQINPTVKLDQESNYATAEIAIDNDAETSAKNDTKKIKKIYSRWLGVGSGATAESLASDILGRHSNVPRKCEFSLDAKDGDLWLGDYIRVTNRLSVDQFGLPLTTNLQVLRANESDIGTRFTYTAQQYILSSAPDDPNNRPLTIAGDLLNVNLREYFDQEYGTPVSGNIVNVTIRAGVTIGGDTMGGGTNIQTGSRVATNDYYDGGTDSLGGATIGQIPAIQRAGIASPRDIAKDATYPSTSFTADYLIKEYPLSIAFDTGTWPAGVVLNLTMEAGAYIVGEGGNGSAHAFKESISGTRRESANGGDGGHAMKIQHAINITNGGTIGGGGGGGAMANDILSGNPYFFGYPGGGGAGSLGSRVRDYILGTLNDPTITSAQGGSNLFGGVASKSTSLGMNQGSADGSGGDLALAGNNATTTLSGGLTYTSGGVPGDAIVSGSNLVTWIQKGDVRGVENV